MQTIMGTAMLNADLVFVFIVVDLMINKGVEDSYFKIIFRIASALASEK